MTLNDTEMKLKMMELVKLMGMTIIDGSIKDNSFQFAKRQKNFIKSFCSTMFNRKGESSEFQVIFHFLKDKYKDGGEYLTIKDLFTLRFENFNYVNYNKIYSYHNN